MKRELTTYDLLIVSKEFKAKFKHENMDRFAIIEKGEIIQFRYQHSAHFRTMKDDKYFVTDQETFLDSTEIIGKIYDKVVFGNKAKLIDIYNLSLFDWFDKFHCLADLYEKYPEVKKVNNLNETR